MADVLVHASLSEAFGLAVVEALCSELMVLVHDSPHFEWLVRDRNCLIDMRETGGLTRRLRKLAGTTRDAGASQARIRALTAKQRFDWRVVAPAYADMYRSCRTRTSHA
jgi:glycosyltransferase involved in cell wall biosynthesis